MRYLSIFTTLLDILIKRYYMHPPIIQETNDWLAVNKHSDMAVEGTKGGSPTVQSTIYDYLSKKKKKPYVGMVHRLDRVTSGVILIAKKKSVLLLLNEIFRERQIQKTYIALSDSAPAVSKTLLEHHLLQDKEERKAILFDTPQAKSKACRLRYEYIQSSDMGYHLIKIALLTGKYHQIRAQLASIGCPIVGDEKYGSKAAYYKRAIALHAWQLQFMDPITKKTILLKAAPPIDPFWNDFKEIL